MKFFKKKNKICGLIAICIVMMLSFQIVSDTNLNDSIAVNSPKSPKISAQISGTKQWLNKTGFDSPIKPWYSTIEGDKKDVKASNNSGVANYEILGEVYTYSAVNGTPTSAKGWTKSKNYQYPAEPNLYANLYGSYGGRASHQWADNGADQQVAVQFDKQILMNRNMSDYVITTASLNLTVNATVQANDRTSGGLEVAVGEASSPTYYNVGDFINYYVVLSDQNKNKNYTDVILYEPNGLGSNNPSGPDDDYLYNTVIEAEDENDLTFILNGLFHNYNNYNITITIGIFFNCEDNDSGFDDDYFKNVYITSCNFTFTYKKNINKDTKISWNQDGKKISELSPENYRVIATDANLKFDYKIDTDWASNTSSTNSELRVLLNGYDHKITIRLTDVNLTSATQNFKLNPPLDSVNLSIQVYLRDEFQLDKTIIISIDNVTLDISYTIYAPDPVSGGGGGGGGTTIIRGPDYTPVVIGLVAGIIALVTFFGAYQKHYKYPPMVRKVRKLRKKIKKGKSVKSLIVRSRENIINSDFQKQMKILEVGVVSSKQLSKVDKISKESNAKKIKGGAK